MDDKPQRWVPQKCVSWYQPGPQTIVVHQVIGETEAQEAIDIHIRVPNRKPAIEQIINVYVNKVCITNIEVLTDTVIVCGHFDVKVLYVACLADQPVHAFEKRRVRFSVEACIRGAQCGMDTDASVAVEFIDYDCDCHRYTKYDSCNHKVPKKCGKVDSECCLPSKHEKKGCTRKCYVSVVLKVIVRVMADREIIVYPDVPIKPKG